jgi:hypothetical protein
MTIESDGGFEIGIEIVVKAFLTRLQDNRGPFNLERQDCRNFQF